MLLQLPNPCLLNYLLLNLFLLAFFGENRVFRRERLFVVGLKLAVIVRVFDEFGRLGRL